MIVLKVLDHGLLRVWNPVGLVNPYKPQHLGHIKLEFQTLKRPHNLNQ